jgi:molecular chaperone GrpE
MVQTQMTGALTKLGVAPMGEVGEAFNPDLHNAVSHVEDENAGENTIAQVFLKGYKIGDKVIRHAMVQVAN